MAQLLPNGRQQFLDANGNPLVGGLVYFYIPNTTTPKDTWQDAAKSALNTNPVVCDARGQATIYGDGDYRQILQDAAGNSIWDKTVSAPVEPYIYDQGSEPTTDIGDIWINGIGACRWNAGDSKYYRAFITQKAVVTSSTSITFDAYTKYVTLSGCGGGGGGGNAGSNASSGCGAGGGGGGAGASVTDYTVTITPGETVSIVIGAAGTGGAVSATNGNPGSAGGATSFGSYRTINGGGGGGGGSFSGGGSVASGGLGGGGTGSCGADAGLNVYGSGQGGVGGSSPFGAAGGAGKSSSTTGVAGGNAVGYGAGGGGGGGSIAGGSTFYAGGAGGNGAPGILIVEW